MATQAIELLNRANNRQFVQRGQLLGTIVPGSGSVRDSITGVPATVINHGTWQPADSRRPVAVSVSLNGVTGAGFIARVLACCNQVQPLDADDNHPQIGSDVTVATGSQMVEADRSYHWIKTVIAVVGTGGTVTSGFCAG